MAQSNAREDSYGLYQCLQGPISVSKSHSSGSVAHADQLSVSSWVEFHTTMYVRRSITAPSRRFRFGASWATGLDLRRVGPQRFDTVAGFSRAIELIRAVAPHLPGQAPLRIAGTIRNPKVRKVLKLNEDHFLALTSERSVP